ncbi:MAG TPA: hypothetical protein PLP27_05590 [Crocinitomicaceae bacterium]|nr:hypothetical protein [Crocinitomicaceae bacterium]
MKIRDLKNLIERNFDDVHKSVGVALVDAGFMKYAKLTAENYDFWWYECADVKSACKKKYTYEWLDLIPTAKFELIKEFISFHQEYENGFGLLNNILNIVSAKNDGINITTGRKCVDEVVELYYSGRKKQPKQLQLF